VGEPLALTSASRSLIGSIVIGPVPTLLARTAKLSKGSLRPEFPAALGSVLEAPGLSGPQQTDVARIA
jgi:hypothetical protein